MTNWLFVPGAGERQDHTCLPYNIMTRKIKPGDKTFILNYKNSIGSVSSDTKVMNQSLIKARESGAWALNNFDAMSGANLPWKDHWVVVAYSLGAYIVSDYLANLQSNRWVKSVVLIGNPRATSHKVGAQYLTGIAGPGAHVYPGVKVVEVSSANDGIASCPPGFLKMLPGIIGVLLAGDPPAALDALRQISFEFRKGNGRLPTPRDIDLLMRYGNGTGHGSDYFKPEMLAKAHSVLG